MNDFDLDAKLKNFSVPERAEDYWQQFPAQVRFQLRRPTLPSAAHASWRAGFVWGTSVSFASFIISLVVFNQPLKTASSAIFKHEQILRQQLAQLPNHLRTFMADEHGLHYLIAEKE